MAAITYINEDEAEGEIAAALEDALRTRGFLSNFHRTLAHLPPVLRAFEQFSAAVRETAPDLALRELTILRVTVLLGNDYEWRRHAVAALELGLTETQLGELGAWESSSAFDETERAVLKLVDAHVADNDVSPAVVEAVHQQLGDTATVQLCVTIGWYLFVGAVILPLRLIEDDAAEPAPVPMPAVAGR